MKKIIAAALAVLMFTMSACNIKIIVEKDSTEAGTKVAESSVTPETEAEDTKASEKSSEEKSSEKKSTEQSSASKETKETETSGTKASGGHDADAPIENLHLLQYSEDYTATRNGEGGIETICRTKYEGYGLVEEEVSKYNDLARLLDSSRDKLKANCKTTFYQICNEPHTDMFDNALSHVVRADSRVVSIYSEHSYWHGGDWHLEKSALNLDPVTGGSIALKDVVNDLPALCKKLESKLRDKYADTFTSNNFLKDGDYFSYETSSVVFTIGYEGLTVYFNEGPQKTDWLNATVYYDEAPGIFDTYYSKASENYVIRFDEEDLVEADVDHDGKREVITVNGTIEDDYISWAVSVNGNRIQIQDQAYSGEFYFVKHHGKYYVHIYQDVDGGTLLAAVDLANRSCATANVDRGFELTELCDIYDTGFGENGSHYERIAYALTDSDEMVLTTGAELLGNNTRYAAYSVGTLGYPVIKESTFGTTGCAVVEAKKDIKCDIVNASGKVIGEALIQKGELFYLARSDYSTYADIQMAALYPFTALDTGYNGIILRTLSQNPGLDPDETIYRLKLQKADWNYQINGEPEKDVFSGIIYAG